MFFDVMPMVQFRANGIIFSVSVTNRLVSVDVCCRLMRVTGTNGQVCSFECF